MKIKILNTPQNKTHNAEPKVQMTNILFGYASLLQVVEYIAIFGTLSSIEICLFFR